MISLISFINDDFVLQIQKGFVVGGGSFLRAISLSVSAGALGEGARFHNLLRRHYIETLPALDRVSH